MASHQVVVALEGIDGAGKSTLINLLNDEFGEIVGTYSRTKKGRIFDFIVSRKTLQRFQRLQIPIYLFLSLKNYISFWKHQCTRGYKRYKEMFQICRVEKSDFPLYFYILAGCAD